MSITFLASLKSVVDTQMLSFGLVEGITLVFNKSKVVMNLALCMLYPKRLLHWLKLSLKRGLEMQNTYPASIIKKPYVYTVDETKIIPLAPTFLKKAPVLPLQFAVSPQYYEFIGECYDLSKAGLYRFILPFKTQRQILVVDNSDAHRMLTGFAWAIGHGERDDRLTHAQLLKKITSEKVFLTCERFARFAHMLMQEWGFITRVIGTRTLSGVNGYDDGHYLLEVFRPDIKRWILYDLDAAVYFTHGGQPLSMWELMQVYAIKAYDVKSLAQGVRLFPSKGAADHQDFFLGEARLADLKSWYERILQCVFIQSGEQYYTYQLNQKDCIRKQPQGLIPPLTFLPIDEFIAKFYAK